MYYYLYQTTNILNGMIYIGVRQSKEPEKDYRYKGSGKYLKRAIKFYGEESFKKEILEYFDNWILMFKREAEIVNEEFIKRDDTYNLVLGGHGGFRYVRGTPDHLIWYEKTFNVKRFKDKNSEEYIDWQNKVNMGKKQSKRSILGKIFYSNPITKKSILITKNQINVYERDGWVRGYIDRNSSYENRIYIHHPTLKLCKNIFKDELEKYLNTGWVIGILQTDKRVESLKRALLARKQQILKTQQGINT